MDFSAKYFSKNTSLLHHGFHFVFLCHVGGISVLHFFIEIFPLHLWPLLPVNKKSGLFLCPLFVLLS